MPEPVTRYTRALAWTTLAVHIGIIVTGGLVRLTGSGLGCPSWPTCTPESLVPTPEMGWHGIIEFGNRTLTGVLCAVALLTYLAVVRTRSELGLARPALWIGLLTIVQAIVGGITVNTELNPNAVGVHFLLSMGLVSIATILLVRVLREEPVPPRGQGAKPGLRGDGPVVIAAGLSYAWTWVTIYLGALTTGSGPHAGDADAKRNGLNPELMQHLHSYPAYILLACAIALLWLAARRPLRAVRNASAGLLLMLIAQAAVGIWQSRTGLPITMVTVHMALSAFAMALMTAVVVLLRRTSSR